MLGGCATLPTSGGASAASDPAHARIALRQGIDSMLATPALRSASWGILIVDPVAAETLYAHNPTKLLIPASNQKLVSSSVMLERLGPDYKYRTTFGVRGSVAGDTIRGDLAVIGRGDPTTSDHMKGDAMQPLRDIADSLRARGVRYISGNVVAVGDAFPGPVAGAGWPWDALDETSFAGVDELLFNEGLITLHVRAGARVGDSASVETLPARTFPRIRNTVVTIAPVQDTGAAARRAPSRRAWGRGSMGTRLSASHDTSAAGVVVVGGTIALGDSAATIITQHDPDRAYVGDVR